MSAELVERLSQALQFGRPTLAERRRIGAALSGVDEFGELPDSVKRLVETLEGRARERFGAQPKGLAIRSLGAAVLADLHARRDDPSTRRSLAADLRHTPGGHPHNQQSHGNTVPGVSNPLDRLRLAGRIDLVPGELFLGSDKVNGDGGTVRLAITERNGARSVRLGIGNLGFGSRDDEAGPWRGNPDSTTQINADRKRLRDERDRLRERWDQLNRSGKLTPTATGYTYMHGPKERAELDAIEARLAELDDMDLGEVFPAGYTARLDQPGVERLRSTLDTALTEGAKLQRTLDADYEAGRETERPEPGFWVFAEGSIPGEWADVHYRVQLDDPAVGVEVTLAAVPHDSGLDFNDLEGSEATADLDPAETRKLLRLLAKLTPGTLTAMSSDDQPRSLGAAVLADLHIRRDDPSDPAGMSADLPADWDPTEPDPDRVHIDWAGPEATVDDLDVTRAVTPEGLKGGARLKWYWTKGPGLAKWATRAHRWTALYRQLLRFMPPGKAKRTAAAWFHSVFGYWPGHQKGKNPVGPG